MKTETPRLPNDHERITIVGRTGSGKTLAALWHLSRRRFDRLPWVILDTKGDEHIERLTDEGIAQEIDFSWRPRSGGALRRPTRGVFVLRPLPKESAELNEFLWAIWEHGAVGVYVDEGYMVGKSDAFDAILTQGRSLRIPVILLSQRPVWLTRFAFSEADYFQVFHLTDTRDHDTVQSFAPLRLEKRLPRYHSWYYDVKRDRKVLFRPVPGEDDLMAAIEEKTRKELPRRRAI